ncbi:hypothetical protein GP486_002509 [Trichoglossum hirsutum]|uniref:Uncharacterized protein n=1 Tax=Trichoglossum hirsutum TaxID=265104 RepID=A0A9P8LET4_9PEZI|nr:hypothetical protein GP486_002509 [Trichoglossum hirsutum]
MNNGEGIKRGTVADQKASDSTEEIPGKKPIAQRAAEARCRMVRGSECDTRNECQKCEGGESESRKRASESDTGTDSHTLGNSVGHVGKLVVNDALIDLLIDK